MGVMLTSATLVRTARYVDVPRIVAILADMHARSVYAGLCAFDDKEARSLVTRSIQRHGAIGVGGTAVFVAEQDGVVRGFIIGHLDRVYFVCHGLTASDLFFCVEPGSDPRCATRLLDAFMAWARGIDAVVEIHMGATNAAGDPERAGKLLERKGLERSGIIYDWRKEA